MRNDWNKKARGAVLPMVGLMLAVLIGMAGLVIDLGSLFVAKSELQSAVDSCALAAAQELDGTSSATARAQSAGLTAGNANNVQFQSVSASLTSADITFSDSLTGSFSSGFSPTAAAYAKCSHTTSGIVALLIKMVGGPSSNSVAAVGVATRSHAQSACPVPIGLIPKTGGTSPDYGFQVGEWVSVLYSNSQAPTPGEMGWYNLNGTTSASETKNEMDVGYCGSKVGDTLGTPGAKVSVDDQWNSRFGIYKNNGNIASMRPDFSGYAYTSQNWTNSVPQNAYNGTPASGSDPTAANFLTKRAAYANYANTGTSVQTGDNITGLSMKGGYQSLATSGMTGQQATYGMSRRLVLVPVVSASKIVDFACMLMLQPVSGPTVTVQFEYRGNASASNSPCTASGLAGGSAGPLVPVLVQ
ncbi:pilus assembly protein TadG-related protein [Cupriavidus malaysiensis]|uniref:Putative Flp pilus-assembly TadG-like N-terminal domain-containing protein n=1 Tax=Cupriavidus malaysiensis TaxID=367825 RepID=A0ABN4TKK8_9BURK|nr:Tad domain-containing protein [Cupriavidus malaysiensis]AOZ05406.1 hypothetical protein BKK80_05985 [Cupriavidus malaysiensis]